MPKMTEEQTLELAKEIVKVLNQNIEWEEPKVQNPLDVYREWFAKFGKNFLTNGQFSVVDFGFKAFEYGISAADSVTREVPLEQLEKEVADWDFMDSVKQWIDETQRGVTPTLKSNPIVELYKEVGLCSECRAQEDLYCDGEPDNICKEKIGQINLDEVVGENPKIG